MVDFVHLHVHSQYSILDGQASIKKMIDKAIADGMKGMALTDHGNMMGVKEFFDEISGRRGKAKKAIKADQETLSKIDDGTFAPAGDETRSVDEIRADLQKSIEKNKRIADFMPIFGCEMYVSRRNDMRLKDGRIDQSGWHLIVLAKNEQGYHNLIKLVSNSWIDGFYMRPRTDRSELERYHEGLIVCSACIGGEVPRKILDGNYEAAEEAIQWYHNLFGEDYYLELQRHEVKDPNLRANRETFPLQQTVNAKLIEYSKKFGIKLICSNDSHFVDEENAEAHDRLICLATGRDLDDPARMLYTKQEWFKTQQEMNEVFSDVPEALANTLEVLGKCEIYDIEHPPIMPFFAIPKEFGTEEEYRERITPEELYNEFTTDENGENPLPKEEADSKIKKLGGIDKLYRIKFEADYLAKLAYDGAKKLYGDPLEKNVADQIKFELHIMKTMGFPGYFLIVQDFINAAFNELGVSVGPGRGSAAGSTVAYCLGITKIDPIKYDLLFERFLNPDRISLPDIDTDFDDDGRGELLRWVTEKYGAEKVAHIITYGAMATKSAIKDVARVQKLPLEISNKLCKLIPDKLPDGLKMNLPNAIKCIPELQQAETSPDDNLRDTIKYAKMLENNIRNTGVHACGTIICRDAISDWVPVSTAEDKETGEKLSCTQYDGHVIESTGLIKMDFLGLKTLSIIKEAIENIKYSLGVIVDETKFRLDDPATYKLYSDGRTIGTFQFESPGMQKYLRELQPSTFEDLIAMNALYRPGPMDYIPDFIDRKLGRKPVEYDIDCMQKYLKDTYGITVYQEQVMLLSRQLADFTRGESDALRKAMGKKKKDIVDKMKPKFIEGGKKNGHDPAILDKIWGDWEKFASYAFNKSHATCYSWVAYQTAYLKAHYPAQYMAAVMSRSLNSITDVTKLMDECKSMGIKTLGPDVNESGVKFAVNHKGNIRFGMGAVKGVGESAALAIILEREQNGAFKDIFDMVERVNLSACNRKAVENLAYAGAFDSFGIKREQFFAPNSKGELFIDCLIRYGNQYQTVKKEATNSLFGGFDAVEIARPAIPNAEEWTALERLNREKDLVGVYLTAHPLDEYAVILNEVCNTSAAALKDKDNLPADRETITVGGIITGKREGISKNGKPFGIVSLEDFNGAGELALFGDSWTKWRDIITVGVAIFVEAGFEVSRYDPSKRFFVIKRIQYLNDVSTKLIDRITITMPIDSIDKECVSNLYSLSEMANGTAELDFKIKDADGMSYLLFQCKKFKVNLNRNLYEYIKSNSRWELNVDYSMEQA